MNAAQARALASFAVDPEEIRPILDAIYAAIGTAARPPQKLRAIEFTFAGIPAPKIQAITDALRREGYTIAGLPKVGREAGPRVLISW